MSDTEASVYRIPERALGIPNFWNGTSLLAPGIGLRRARDWTMTTRRMFADELIQCGWAQRSATALQQWRSTEEQYRETGSQLWIGLSEKRGPS